MGLEFRWESQGREFVGMSTVMAAKGIGRKHDVRGK